MLYIDTYNASIYCYSEKVMFSWISGTPNLELLFLEKDAAYMLLFTIF